MRREVLWLACLAVVSCKRAAPVGPDATLTFMKDGVTVRALPLSELAKTIAPETVSGFDPYHRKPKRFRALPLRRVLEAGFPGESLADKEFVLRAKDGYAVYFRGALAVTEGGYVAFEDLDVPSWEPIGPQRADPSPFYVVWSKPEQVELEAFPRPWQLVKIEMVRFDVAYPHTSPGSGASSAALAGYALFRQRCFQCHAVNREGGRVGPDLSVPKNVLEYRPVAEVRAYIKDPRTFRYGNMPPHPDLTEADLDALVAYLEAMRDRKFDPGK